VGHGVASGREVALQVDPDHRVPLLLGRVGQHAVAEEPGVVDQDVEATEGVDRRRHQRLGLGPIGHVGPVGHRVAAHGADGVDHLTGRTRRTTGAVDLGAEVVDDDLRPLPCELERMAPTDATTCARHDHDPSVTDAHAADLGTAI
jgi:hypothetical protein